MSYKFIPVNAGSKRRPLVLAVVDASYHEALSRFTWVSDTAGIVFRTALIGSVRVKKKLFHDVATTLNREEHHAAYENDDPRDCRTANLRFGIRSSIQVLRPGHVVAALPGHAEALKAAQAAGPTRGRRARLTPAQTLAVLDECVYGSLKGATCATISDFIADRFNVSMHRSQVGQMVDGKCLRVAKFNYAKLRKTRPSPTARALERAKTL